jgi:hypothetical protein
MLAKSEVVSSELVDEEFIAPEELGSSLLQVVQV